MSEPRPSIEELLAACKNGFMYILERHVPLTSEEVEAIVEVYDYVVQETYIILKNNKQAYEVALGPCTSRIREHLVMWNIEPKLYKTVAMSTNGVTINSEEEMRMHLLLITGSTK